MTSLLLGPGQPVGPYLIETYLTTGTFGDVYRARHSGTQELVALKVVDVPFGVRVGLDIYALGEQVLTLDHPCLVPVRELHLDETPQYVVMAYAAGGSLSSRLDSTAPALLGVEEALPLLAQVGSALTYLQGRGIVHRGVQPASILFGAAGGALLSGLDLACSLAHLGTPVRIVTAGYAAPEERQGMASPQSDQYALACVAYRLLAGSPPSPDMRADLARRVEELAIPARIGQVILRALRAAPGARWERITAFIAALEAAKP
jgi:serine/threonine protein kinase